MGNHAGVVFVTMDLSLDREVVMIRLIYFKESPTFKWHQNYGSIC